MTNVSIKQPQSGCFMPHTSRSDLASVARYYNGLPRMGHALIGALLLVFGFS